MSAHIECQATDTLSREARMVVVERDDRGTPTIWCDPCIETLVRALNTHGLVTKASCCGHGQHRGWVILADGRVLTISPDLDDAHRIEVSS